MLDDYPVGMKESSAKRNGVLGVGFICELTKEIHGFSG